MAKRAGERRKKRSSVSCAASALADVADDRQAERLGSTWTRVTLTLTGHRLAALPDEAVTLLRVEEGRVAVGLDQPVEGRRRVGDDQVGQAERQGLAAVEPGQAEGRRVEVDHAEVARVEDEQGVVRLAEQAAGDLQLPGVVHGLPLHGAPGRREGPAMATRKPCVKWGRSGGSGIREAERVRATVS